MASRKKGCDCPPPAPAWMATYSDLVTLLLTFFVLLMSMASFDNKRLVQAVMESIHEAFGMSGLDVAAVHTFTERGYTEPQRLAQSTQPTVARLREAFAKHLSDDVIRISQQEQEVRFRIDDRVFFRPGSAELHPAAYSLIADLAVVLADEQVDIRVEGHTDSSGSERDNWELSAMRSLAVVEAFREKGPVAGERLEVVAFGSFRNASYFGESDEWNRRIELVLNTDKVGSAALIRELDMVGGSGGGP